MAQKYKGVSLPAGMVEDVEKMIGSCGYVSVSDFVKDAVRRRLEELRIVDDTSSIVLNEFPTTPASTIERDYPPQYYPAHSDIEFKRV